MKRTFLLLVINMCSIIVAFAQGESVKPTYGINVEREVSEASINGKTYSNVTVELRAADIADYFAEGVRIIVTDTETGAKIYKKRFSKSRLYAFSDGEIQVGYGNALTQVIIRKKYGIWTMNLRERGIY